MHKAHQALVALTLVALTCIAAAEATPTSSTGTFTYRGAVTPSPPPAGANCHASYTPCLPIVGDLDCADIRAMGVAPVRVLGSDPYRLDGDDDGWGCE